MLRLIGRSLRSLSIRPYATGQPATVGSGLGAKTVSSPDQYLVRSVWLGDRRDHVLPRLLRFRPRKPLRAQYQEDQAAIAGTNQFDDIIQATNQPKTSAESTIEPHYQMGQISRC